MKSIKGTITEYPVHQEQKIDRIATIGKTIYKSSDGWYYVDNNSKKKNRHDFKCVKGIWRTVRAKK